jgi:hypothetical protein
MMEKFSPSLKPLAKSTSDFSVNSSVVKYDAKGNMKGYMPIDPEHHDMYKCATCMCWISTNGEYGDCKAHAPSPSLIKGDALDFTVVLPVTMESDGCYHDYHAKA